MITVEIATNLILKNIYPINNQLINIEKSIGCILKEDLVADRDFPPFDRVTMDGIAILHHAFANGQRAFPVENIQAAGAPQLALRNPAACIEVMTGAVLPKNTDTIIRYEDVTIENGVATIVIEGINFAQNVHFKGKNRLLGDVLVKKETIISPAEVATAATIGKHKLLVAKPLRAAIISTGDELVSIQKTPLSHQIRRSNVYALAALLGQKQVQCRILHVSDTPEKIKKLVEKCLLDNDFLILSGGVSMGKFDFIPSVFKELGVKEEFHKIAQKPGKPFWYGVSPEGKSVFALPGNPVSTFMCATRYVLPWVDACLGIKTEAIYAILQERMMFKPSLTQFLQIKLQYSTDGSLLATPVEGGGSGDLANLNDADGFIELPSDQTIFEKGQVFRVWKYR
jgi:molybdopterin molybdotransferase